MPERRTRDLDAEAVNSFEGRVAAEFSSELETVATRLAQEAGPPPGAERIHDTQAARLWGQRDPRVDHEQLARQLVTAGLTPEEMAASGWTIFQEAPQLVAEFAKPAGSLKHAAALATLAEYPFRYRLAIVPHEDPREQVKAAEQLDRLWARSAGRDTSYDPPPDGAEPPVAPTDLPQPPPEAPQPELPTAPGPDPSAPLPTGAPMPPTGGR